MTWLLALYPPRWRRRYASLKGRSLATQSIFIGGMILILTLIFVIAEWIAVKI